MAASPTVASSPTVSLLDWDEAAVQAFLANVLQMPQYEELIYEHGITGDVLAEMEHTALADMGITSLGHRLKLLRAVWEIKKEQGLQIGEDDWKPADAPAQMGEGGHTNITDRLGDVINELQERLLNLERDHVRTLTALEEHGIPVPVASSADGDLINGIMSEKVGGGSRWRDYNGRGVDGEAEALFPTSLASSTATAPLTSDSATFGDAFTPTTANAAITFDSPSHLQSSVERNGTLSSSASGLKSQTQAAPPSRYHPNGTGGNFPSAGSPGHAPTSTTPTASSSKQSGNLAAGSNSGAIGASPEGGQASLGSTPSDSKTKAKDEASREASRAAKSFRVTLEDPCWKVLPAALKKYKINDDWKQYALFICFGNTGLGVGAELTLRLERCLSYDEKPLMLFQKLKEGGQKPVFMLRHIRDIRSPIAVAQQKQLAKLGLPPNSTVNVLPKIKPMSDTSISPTKASSLQPGVGREEGQTPSGGTFPELPSPGLREGEGGPKSAATGQAHGTGAGAAQGSHGTLVDKEGVVREVTYAVAIYPYIADRQDEFDVAVGATFVILSKAKGWYIVQKDPDGLGNIVPDQSRSGWVPAGCLLELSSPISAASPAAADGVPAYPGLSPLPPSAIMSSSYPGIVLMDYAAKGGDELTLKEGQHVKVYKKYCHWSYTIKTETGERGWVPAWFIGKISSGSGSAGTDSNPSTATTSSLGPKSAEAALGASTGGSGGASGEEEVDTSFESAGSKEDAEGRREGVKGYL
ncbi:hypothetical protein JCM24511_00930 [Saitozyma sp. JCM 24511]|nr:hypothetical protein JCM24511_00930 [Saitozyma sp. JCM 24511]